MQIVCPNCETSYDVDAAAFGAQGRTVRCVRCKETWLARAQEPATADAFADNEAEHRPDAPDEASAESPTPADAAPEPAIGSLPEIASPPIAHDPMNDIEWSETPVEAALEVASARKEKTSRRLSLPRLRLPRLPKPRISLPVAVAAMAGLCISLVIWRQDMVRALPQTAGFFNAVRMPVNLRQMAFKDVTITAETVNGAKVFLIEGAITGTAKSPMDIPRLRFVVSDERGQEIYAWNAMPEQTVLLPGEKVSFRSRLASPPADARNVTVRFFSRRDLTAGRA
jgi:predicted Zn finger-like uncharacterized protein